MKGYKCKDMDNTRHRILKTLNDSDTTILQMHIHNTLKHNHIYIIASDVAPYHQWIQVLPISSTFHF